MKNRLLKLSLILSLFLGSIVNAQECQDNWLSVEGNKIVDINGTEVTLAGVNWFGFETDVGAPHGLWNSSRNLAGMLQQIKDLGFNCVRVPWSNQTMFGNVQIDIYEGTTDAYTNLGPAEVNESMASTPLELLDIMVAWCQENDMRIILDNHSRSNESGAHLNEPLWYRDGITSHEEWIEDWIAMAERYVDAPAVVAMDLNNEPHELATWGSGDPATDWRMAAEECGNAILAVNPNVLIIVEGIQKFTTNGVEENTWWGGNLQGVREYPVELNVTNKLVYSPHEYGPHLFFNGDTVGGVTQPWFEVDNFEENLPSVWENYFNYINTNGTAPLLVGEFGIKEELEKSVKWMETLVAFISDQGLHYTYWCMNPNSGDTGGIWQDDWVSINDWKMELLEPILSDPIPNCVVYTGEPILSNEEFAAEVANFKVYPNPTSDVITFSTSTSNLKEIVLYSVSGSQVYTGSSIASKSVFEFDISNLPNGIYLAKVTSVKGEQTTVKILKN